MNLRNLLKGSQRTTLLKKNVAVSLILKGISILISFIVVPITIDFVDSTQYGLWLTLSSLVSWFYFFDLGLTLGLRNRFAEAKAKEDFHLARCYVTTTYVALSILMTVALIILLPLNQIIDWCKVLNLDPAYSSEIRSSFSILIFFFCLNIILQVMTTVITADQRPALTSFIQVLGQGIGCIIIIILTKTLPKGNIEELALVFSGVPVCVILITSVILFSSRYKQYSPSLKYYKKKYIRDLFGLGGKFFIITTSLLFIIQIINLVLTRVLGPDSVTEYNIAYKYFSIILMVQNIILVPFWAASTDAYSKGDYCWIINARRKLERLWCLCIPVLIIMLIFSKKFYEIWIGDNINISINTSISVAIYVQVNMISAMYTYLLNGIGKVTLQMIIYSIFGLIAFPLMSYLCRIGGISAMLSIPIVVLLIQAIFSRMQLNLILNNRAKGIWNK